MQLVLHCQPPLLVNHRKRRWLTQQKLRLAALLQVDEAAGHGRACVTISGQTSVVEASTQKLTHVIPGSSFIHLNSWPQASQGPVQVPLEARPHKPGMYQALSKNGSTPQGRPQSRPPTSPTPVESQVSCCVVAVPGGGSWGAAGLRGEATASPAGWLVWARGSVRLPVLCFSADLLMDLRRSRSESMRTSHGRTTPDRAARQPQPSTGSVLAMLL